MLIHYHLMTEYNKSGLSTSVPLSAIEIPSIKRYIGKSASVGGSDIITSTVKLSVTVEKPSLAKT